MNAFRRRIDYSETCEPNPLRRAGRVWFILPFVVLGVAIMAVMVSLAQHHGDVLALLTLLALPVAVVLLVVGLVKAMGRVRMVTSQLTSWHFLWMLIFASALVFRTRGVNQIYEDPLDGWAIYRVTLEFIVAAVLLTRLAVRRPDWLGSMFQGFVGVLTVFSVMCAISTVWSVFPVWTLYRSFEYLLDLALLAAILETVRTTKGFESLFNWTWVLYGLLLASAWIGAIVWPQPALYPHGFKIGVLGVRLTGVVPQVSSDDIGVFAAMLGLVSLCRLLPIGEEKYDRTWYGIAFAASMVTMIFSQTRSAFAGFLLGLFLLLYFSRRLRMSAAFAFVLGPLLLLTSAGTLVWQFLRRGEDQQQLATLSSRLIWWSFAWHKFMQRPLLGFGAYAAGRFDVLAKIGMSRTSSLHSDFLGVIVGTGIWGLIPFVTALVGMWWFLSRYLRHANATSLDKQLAYEAVTVFAVLTVNAFFLPMLTWQASLYFLVIVGYAEFLRRRQAQRSWVAAVHSNKYAQTLAAPH